MWNLDTLIKKIDWSRVQVDQDNDGQIIVYTNLKEDDSENLVDMEDVNAD